MLFISFQVFLFAFTLAVTVNKAGPINEASARFDNESPLPSYGRMAFRDGFGNCTECYEKYRDSYGSPSRSAAPTARAPEN